jgi:hypothetical protein
VQSPGAGLDTNKCSWSHYYVANTCSVWEVGTRQEAGGRKLTGGTLASRRSQLGRCVGFDQAVSSPGPVAGTGEKGAHPHRGSLRNHDCSRGVATPARAGSLRIQLLLATVATALVVALALPWGGAGEGTLASPGPARAGALSSHSSYVVQPGDTLWTIAQRLAPGGDPRPVEWQLEAEVGGDTIVPGERLVLPRSGLRPGR